MDEKMLKEIVAMYFGFTPKINGKKIKISVVPGEGEEKMKIKWEEHIGNLSGVARVSPLDIMHDMDWENTDENYAKAVEIMKSVATEKGVYLVKVEKENRYLLINTKYRR